MEEILVTRTAMPEYGEFIEMIKPLWDSRWLTNMGEYHERLEAELKNFLQVPNISLMVNGHMALELAIQAMGFPEGAEIITTPFTFISTTHAIIRNKLTPVFCDIKLDDFTIDEDKIENLITEKTVAILPVHVYGNICNVKRIDEIAEKYNLKVIYDAAHAFGETAEGVAVGNFGDASCFSFHATKVFNTIEGGAVAFREDGLYRKLYNLKNFGIRSEEVIAEVGANAKMNEFCAIMGLCNLKYTQENIRRREALVKRYSGNLDGLRGIQTGLQGNSRYTYSYGYFPVLFKPEVLGEGARDRIFHALAEHGIYARKYFFPITADAACFKNKYRKLQLDCARYAGGNILVLPLYPDLQHEAVDRISGIIRDCVE